MKCLMPSTSVLLAAAVATMPAVAQTPQQQFQQGVTEENTQLRQMMLLHAEDEIINASITNMEQEDLGSIDALVVDLTTHRVAYAIVSFGGFLGIGDTLHAVPFKALQTRPLFDGLVLDITRSQLEHLRGFEREQLPNFADEQWSRSVHRDFSITPYWEQRDSAGHGEQQMQREELLQQQQRDERTYPGMEQRQFITTYELIDIAVENHQGEEIGTIRDFVIDFHNGSVEYTVMAYGGWLGMGETHTAIPMGAFEPRGIHAEDPTLVLNVTRDQLREAPEYRYDHWPRLGAANWAQHMVRQQRSQ